MLKFSTFGCSLRSDKA